MSRSTIFQNWLKSGDLLLDFENAGDWVIPYPAEVSKEANTSQIKQGMQSLKVTTTANHYYNVVKYVYTTPLSIATKGRGAFSVWIFPHSAAGTIAEIDMQVSSTTAPGEFLKIPITDLTKLVVNEWNQLVFFPENAIAIGGISWGNLLANGIKEIRLNAIPATGCTSVVSYDELRMYSEGIPIINLMFDDGHEKVINNAYPVMSDYGLRGTAYIISSLVGTAGAMTEANLETLHNAGWALANHTKDHLNLMTLSQAQQEDQFTSCRNWLDARGYTRASRHVAYPYGTNNSNTMLAMAATGMLTGRITTTGYLYPPYNYKYRIFCSDANRNVSLSTVLSWIRAAIAAKKGLNILFHRIVETFTDPPVDTEWLLSNFMAVVQEIAVSGCMVINIDEWYQGLNNPRYRSVIDI